MNTKGIARILLAGLVCTMAACGGGGGGGGGEAGGSPPTEGTLHPGVGTDSGTLPPPQDSGSDHPPQQNPGSGSGSGTGSGSTPGDNPTSDSGGSGQVPGGNAGGDTGGSNENPPPSGGNGDGAPGSSCADMISRCFDTAGAVLTKYKGNKQAAASYTFDDGYQTSFDIASLFEQRNLRASFYIVPATVPDDAWARWKILAEKGHEVGTHSMTHTIDLGNPALTDEQLNLEITQAQSAITQKTGIKPKVFAFPWHSYSERARSVALQTHMAIRSPDVGDTDYTLSFFDQEHYPDSAQTLAAVNEQLRSSVAEGGWFVAAGHGLDGDGWSPVTTQFLVDHLGFASGFSSRLWIDTYVNVARYRLCRKQVAVNVTVDSSQQMTVRLSGNYDPSVCSAALTVGLPLATPLPASLSVASTDGQAMPFASSGTMLLLDIVPGHEVRITTSAATQQ